MRCQRLSRIIRAASAAAGLGVLIAPQPDPALAESVQKAGIEQSIRSMGAVIDGPAMAALFAPLQEREPYAGVRVSRDAPYGPAALNVLDVFSAEQKTTAPRPILIFVHGGGFNSGDKRAGAGSPFYDNVALWAVRHGFAGINMNYRKAPEARWPAAAEDVALAVRWAEKNAESFGGDPNRIYVMGHSAGATHVASYVSDSRLWGGPRPPVRGAVIISGSFVAESLDRVPAGDRPFVEKAQLYFGDRLDDGRSSLDGLTTSKVPLLIVNAEFDPPYFTRQRSLLEEAVRGREKRSAEFVTLPGENHMSEVFSVNSPDTSLSDRLLRFIGDQ